MRERSHIIRPLPRGFTLIELMITVVVAGILAAIAIPSYQTYMMKSRREDARTTLAAMVQAQERYRSNNASYSSSASFLLSGAASAAASSYKGHYDMSVTDLSPAVNFVSGYEIHAKPKSGDPQANDTACSDIFVRVSGGSLSYRDGSMADTAISSPCWPQ